MGSQKHSWIVPAITGNPEAHGGWEGGSEWELGRHREHFSSEAHSEPVFGAAA